MFTVSPVTFDGFTIHLAPLTGCGEVFDLPTRTVWVDPTDSSLEAAAAHVVAHIQLRHHLHSRGDFTPAQCDEADGEAERILLASTWQLHPVALVAAAA